MPNLMTAQQTFLIAALTCGTASFMMAALWRVAGTNQGKDVKHHTIGACVCGFVLALVFLFLSVIVE